MCVNQSGTVFQFGKVMPAAAVCDSDREHTSEHIHYDRFGLHQFMNTT